MRTTGYAMGHERLAVVHLAGGKPRAFCLFRRGLERIEYKWPPSHRKFCQEGLNHRKAMRSAMTGDRTPE